MAKSIRDPLRSAIASISREILALFAQPGVLTYLTVKSEIDRLKALAKTPVGHFSGRI